MNPRPTPEPAPAPTPEPTPDLTPDLARLRARLAHAATEHGLLDVAYRTVDSPLGTLLLAATQIGLVRVAFAGEGHDTVLQGLADTVSPRVLQTPAPLEGVAHQLDAYFTGRRTTFDVPLDWRLARGFRAEVLHHLATDVGYGATVSYAGLAGLAGRPAAVRAAASACTTNPLPLVVPCHRVVRADGRPGDYRGGAGAKLLLLELEQAGA